LEEERQEGNHEYQEDTNDTTLDPSEDGDKVVATQLTGQHQSRSRVLANLELCVEGTEEQH